MIRQPRKTKIVCTLGPAVSSPEMLRELIRSGMDVARFNFSHGNHEAHRKAFLMLDEARNELGLPVAAMLDTRGPEIRTTKMKDGKKIFLEAGALVTLTPDDVEGTPERIGVTHKTLARDVAQGGAVLIDDGLIELTVENIVGDDVVCRVKNSGPVSDNKGINLPGAELSMPYLSERDISDILFGVECGFDYIAASFVSCAQDVVAVRRLLDSKGCHSIRIISKIESARALENIDEILRVSDGIMVARGDLGVEIPLEEVPVNQKALIKKALSRGKVVITATQMLESMTEKPRPTRAEAADVANAIYDGTSAVMLSGETAAGKYPIEAVRTMSAIARRAEADINYHKRMGMLNITSESDMTYAISHATCSIAHDLSAAAILPVTYSGYTARMISSFRPAVSIVACTPSLSTYRQLSLSWGVTPLLITEQAANSDEILAAAQRTARAAGALEDGDIVVLTAGVPVGIPGTTNLIKVDVIGDVLATGLGIGKTAAAGRLCVARSVEEAQMRFLPGDILALPQTDNSLLPLLRQAAGVITEEGGANSHAAVVGLTLGIPVLAGVSGATVLLQNGVTVQLDPMHGCVRRTSSEE